MSAAPPVPTAITRKLEELTRKERLRYWGLVALQTASVVAAVVNPLAVLLSTRPEPGPWPLWIAIMSSFALALCTGLQSAFRPADRLRHVGEATNLIRHEILAYELGAEDYGAMSPAVRAHTLSTRVVAALRQEGIRWIGNFEIHRKAPGAENGDPLPLRDEEPPSDR